MFPLNRNLKFWSGIAVQVYNKSKPDQLKFQPHFKLIFVSIEVHVKLFLVFRVFSEIYFWKKLQTSFFQKHFYMDSKS